MLYLLMSGQLDSISTDLAEGLEAVVGLKQSQQQGTSDHVMRVRFWKGNGWWGKRTGSSPVYFNTLIKSESHFLRKKMCAVTLVYIYGKFLLIVPY